MYWQVLMGGWGMLKETLLFATDATVAAALYASRGGPGPASSSFSSSSSLPSSSSALPWGGSFAYDYVDDATVALGEDGMHISITPAATTAGTRISHAATTAAARRASHTHSYHGGEGQSEMDDVRGDPPPPPSLPPQLAAAARKKLLLVLACTLALPETSPLHATASAHASYTTDHRVAATAGPAPERLAVSGRDGARTVDALRGLDHPAVYVVDAVVADDDKEEDRSNASAGVALAHAPLLFALPPPTFGARTCLTSLEMDHACLCLSPPLHVAPPSPGTGNGTGAPAAASAFVVGLGSGNVKSLEGQVELLLTPTRRLDRNATLLAEFDKQVDNAVRYVLSCLRWCSKCMPCFVSSPAFAGPGPGTTWTS